MAVPDGDDPVAPALHQRQDRGNRIIAIRDGHTLDLDMEEALAMTKTFQMDRYQVLEALTNNGGPRIL